MSEQVCEYCGKSVKIEGIRPTHINGIIWCRDSNGEWQRACPRQPDQGAQPTDKEKVLKVYPEAQACWTSRGWRIFCGHPTVGTGVQEIGRTLSAHVPEDEAWADAASKLPVSGGPHVCKGADCDDVFEHCEEWLVASATRNGEK